MLEVESNDSFGDKLVRELWFAKCDQANEDGLRILLGDSLKKTTNGETINRAETLL